ncbi:MAG: polysaccharide deacetylase family protein [Clostridia bacterium]|nr:polysaccharide deacetylase family protein [Clostridia bacterium]
MRYRFLRFPDFRCKAVTFSFDDGHTDDIKLVEGFNRYGLKGTFNISSARFAEEKTEGPRKLTKEEALDLYYPNGHEVAVHGLRHISPFQSAPPVMIREMLEDRIGLEKIFGRIIVGSAFPDDGRSSPEIQSRMRDMGFGYCRCLAPDPSISLPLNWLALQPTTKHNYPGLFEMAEKFVKYDVKDLYIAHRASKWFYTWGHAHEFRRDDNWDLVDKIGEALGGRDDVWYATNTEIYNYVKAYESLQFAADDSIVYNPTLYTVYMEVDAQNVVIKPGETLYL